MKKFITLFTTLFIYLTTYSQSSITYTRNETIAKCLNQGCQNMTEHNYYEAIRVKNLLPEEFIIIFSPTLSKNLEKYGSFNNGCNNRNFRSCSTKHNSAKTTHTEDVTETLKGIRNNENYFDQVKRIVNNYENVGNIYTYVDKLYGNNWYKGVKQRYQKMYDAKMLVEKQKQEKQRIERERLEKERKEKKQQAYQAYINKIKNKEWIPTEKSMLGKWNFKTTVINNSDYTTSDRRLLDIIFNEDRTFSMNYYKGSEISVVINGLWYVEDGKLQLEAQTFDDKLGEMNNQKVSDIANYYTGSVIKYVTSKKFVMYQSLKVPFTLNLRGKKQK